MESNRTVKHEKEFTSIQATVMASTLQTKSSTPEPLLFLYYIIKL